MNFNYKHIERNIGGMRTPSIPIRMEGEIPLDTLGLIDSGADLTAILKSLAELLGLKLTGQKEKCDGIAGETNCTETKVTIRISKGHENYNFTIPVKVILEDVDFPVLLGRKGFFDKFRIIFDEANEKLSLKRNTRS